MCICSRVLICVRVCVHAIRILLSHLHGMWFGAAAKRISSAIKQLVHCKAHLTCILDAIT